MKKDKQTYQCPRTQRWGTPIETVQMDDSLHTLWWLCPVCGNWHAELNAKEKMQNAKNVTRPEYSLQYNNQQDGENDEKRTG